MNNKVPKLTKVLKPYFHEIKEMATLIWQRGWAEWGAGNFSADITDLFNSIPRKEFKGVLKKDDFNYDWVLLMSASGAKMRKIMIDPNDAMCILLVWKNLKFNLILDNKGRDYVTMENLPHLKLQKFYFNTIGSGACVVHAHPAEIIAFSQLPEVRNAVGATTILSTVLPEIMYYLRDGVGFVSEMTPGSIELAEATVMQMIRRKVAIWQKHGIIASAPSFMEAFDIIDLVNKAARIYLELRRVHGVLSLGTANRSIIDPFSEREESEKELRDFEE